MAKKGVCLARCTGELHPGPSGWMHVSSEVLELLTSRRAEQRAPDALWRPLWGIEGKFTLSRRCENSRNKMLLML